MAYIKLTKNHPLVDGESLTFKAPCDCTEAAGIKVTYPIINESSASTTTKTFTLRDANGNNLTNIDNLFVAGAYITVSLDVTNNYAYIQNPATNGYLESKLNGGGSTKVDTVLSKSGWSNSIYTLTNSAITATSPVEIQPRNAYASLTSAQVEAFISAMIVGGTQAAGSIQLKAMGDVPTIDIPVTVIIRGDL